MKKNALKTLRFVFYALGAMLFMTPTAYAYIDPATTSYVVQIVAGIVIACGTGIGIVWSRMRRKMKKKNEETAESAPERETKGGVLTAEDLLGDDDNGHNS